LHQTARSTPHEGARIASSAFGLQNPGIDHGAKKRRRQRRRMHHPGKSLRHLVRSGHVPRRDLVDRIGPELQPHLGDQRFRRHVGNSGDLEVEGIKREQTRALIRGAGHRREKPVRVAAAHQFGAGRDAHLGLTTASA
jgi:hypothetical protein